ncbi:MAG: Holliday junction branch migration protein RuvA [Patescibacteria group bacterium]
MIGALRGVVDTLASPIIVMVGGVGYRVFVPDHLMGDLKPGAPIMLYIHTHVREDALDLYGFLSQEELSLFLLLISVSGIGPRTALAVIDRGATLIRRAIATADVSFFTTIPRLGKKNAQKIIIELKTKLGSLEELDLSTDDHGQTRDVLEALESMGFGKTEAIEAIKQIKSSDVTVEDKIRLALKYLSKNQSHG